MNPESVERMSKAFNQLGTALGEAARSIVDIFTEIFSNTWDSIKNVYQGLDKQISRKKFIKILMSKGIQRNEANKIAWQVHEKNKKYTLMDCVIAIKNKEE